jgi:hypothetical protein
MCQVFEMVPRYVACVVYRFGKVDRDIAHVAIVVHVCFKCMFQIFLLFQTNVTSVLSAHCKSRSRCYIYILQAYV